MSSFRENIRLANALVVVLLSGRATGEFRAADASADVTVGAGDAARLSLVITGAYRVPKRRSQS